LKPAAAVETADIESLDHEGRGVAHVGGKAVFVDGALPGESVTFRRTRRQRRHDEAAVVEIHHASADRVAPRCWSGSASAAARCSPTSRPVKCWRRRSAR
jgi:tRNA/tmRNA/rRNA uracil-C5-methylase (TrmA/RlmC/RlmD family)